MKTVIFTIFVPGIVAVYIPWRLRDHAAPAVHGVEAFAAAMITGIGVLIYLHTAFWGFAWSGGGTPAPIAPTKRLVVAGLHKYLRNPMYLGVGLAIGGQAWLFHSRATAVYLAAFAVLVNSFVLLYEEPTLRKQFGEEYECYRSSVPRWIPRMRSRTPRA